MADSPPSAETLPTHPPETAEVPAPDQDEALGASGIKSRFRQQKLLVVLGTTTLGGVLLGVGGMTLIAYLQPTAKEHQAPPAIIAPARAPEQTALVEELKELKAKNEKLEEQLKLPAQLAPTSAPMHDAVALPAQDAVSAVAPVAAPAPVPTVIYRNRPTRAGGKEKVTEDCTVPDKDEKLGEKLKACIEGFNTSTR
jgi:hypothetical protein